MAWVRTLRVPSSFYNSDNQPTADESVHTDANEENNSAELLCDPRFIKGYDATEPLHIAARTALEKQ